MIPKRSHGLAALELRIEVELARGQDRVRHRRARGAHAEAHAASASRGAADDRALALGPAGRGAGGLPAARRSSSTSSTRAKSPPFQELERRSFDQDPSLACRAELTALARMARRSILVAVLDEAADGPPACGGRALRRPGTSHMPHGQSRTRGARAFSLAPRAQVRSRLAGRARAPPDSRRPHRTRSWRDSLRARSRPPAPDAPARPWPRLVQASSLRRSWHAWRRSAARSRETQLGGAPCSSRSGGAEAGWAAVSSAPGRPREPRLDLGSRAPLRRPNRAGVTRAGCSPTRRLPSSESWECHRAVADRSQARRVARG